MMKPTKWKLRMFEAGVKHKCWMCGRHLTYEIATVDHIKPKALGGLNTVSNYRLACYRCNRERGCSPLTKEQKRLLYGPNQKPENRKAAR